MFSLFKTDFSRSEKIFIWNAIVCAFLISFEYGITRPACNAVVLSTYSATIFPYAWLATVPLNFLILALYNRILSKQGCLTTFLCVTVAIMGVNTFCAIYLKDFYWLPFFQFVWKDVYILLMLKQFWSLTHTMISFRKAKYLYGLFSGVGGLGSIGGALLSSSFVLKLGTQKLFFFTLPIYFLLFFFYRTALFQNKEHASYKKIFVETGISLRKNVSLVMQSKHLRFILLLVVFMQVSIALVDYQFNVFLEKNILGVDLKTQYMGRLMCIVNVVTVMVQFFGAYFLIHFVGLKGGHLFVPFALNINAILFVLFPSFLMASSSFVLIKSIDYSLFQVIREMLYIPMNINEKFRAKAFIDVFAYRSAKAIASLILLGAQFFVIQNLAGLIGGISIGLFIMWFFVVKKMFHHTKPIEEQLEMH